MELRVAPETRVKRGIEQRALAAGVAFTLVPVEEALHALSVPELDHRKAGLLFEQATETCGTEPGFASNLREPVVVFIAEQEPCRALDGRVQAPCGHLPGAIEALPRVQKRVAKAGVQKSGFVGGFGELSEELFET
jgi:hypothetical protein